MGETAQTRTLDLQLFRDIFNASPIGIAVENLEGHPLFVNPALCSMLGFSEEELYSKHCVDFSPREDAQKDWGLFQQLKAGLIDHYQLEKHYFRRDGSLVWGSLSISLLNSRPSPLVLAMVEDITQKKKAEQELATASERLHLAIESGSVGGWDYDLKTGKNLWFGTAHAQLGISSDETLGSLEEFWERVHLDDREHLRRAIQIARDKHEGFAEDFRVVCRGGTIHWLRSAGRYYYSANGEPERMLGISLDITQSKQAEQALQQVNRALGEQTALLQVREEVLQIFVKNVPVGVAMFDRNMRYLQVSDRWCADYSLDSSRVLGRSYYELLPDIPDRWKEMHRRGLKGETLRADEDRWDRKGGTKWVRWEIRPWWNLDSLPGGILIFAEDITHRKQTEEVLSGMTRKLVEAQELERARIGRELHDDFAQRLVMLTIDLELLGDNPSEVRQRVQELQKQTTEISNDIQVLSHELHSSKLEYLGLMAGMRSLCKEFAERHRIEIDFKSHDVPSSLPREISICLFRVLQEALNNAIKHSAAKHIDVQLRGDLGEIHLVVSDSGKGFDTEAVMQGLGLGLTSMQERVRLVNGTISIESKPMRGTTIHVRVPLQSEHETQREAV